jgi:hypothetical protein
MVCLVTAGYVTTLSNAPAPDILSAHDWLGIWLDGQNVVQISGTPDDTLSIVAVTYRPRNDGSGMDSVQLDFEAVPLGAAMSTVVGGDSNCGAQMINLRKTLVVRDNGRCAKGAARFDGVYIRQ